MNVETKTSADTALEYLSSNCVDCIVSDYEMPQKDGIEFLKTVRQNQPHTPFILFTGQGSEEIASEAISAGVTDYLQKGGTEKYELLANRIERAVSEARLQEHRRSMGQDPLELLEKLDDPLYALDEDCVFTYVNKAATGLFETDETELLDNCIWELFPEAKKTPFYQHYRRAAEGEVTEAHTIEEPFEPWGTWYREYLYPNESGVAIISKEITEEKQRELSFQRNQELLKRVEELTDVGGFEADIETGEQIWTDGTYRVHDLDPDGKFDPTVDNALEFYHPDDQEVIEQAVEQCVSEGVSYEKDLRITTDSGRDRWIRTYGVPVKRDGEITHIRGAAEDITKQKRREKRLQEKNERLEEFTSMVSHDLRSPLSVAQGQLELARRDATEESVIDSLKEGDRALTRMDEMLDELLTLARQGDVVNDPGSVAVRDVAESAWQAVNTLDAQLTVSTDMVIQADRGRLRSLLENLYQNAIDHGRSDVELRVGGTEAGFFVEDDGPGIPEANREAVFKAGYSSSEEGVGFGLSIVNRIVEAHEWQIRVTEGRDGGARFEITSVEFAE